jgi:thioredoxin 1
MSLILYMVIGGALGGTLGYFGKCSTGACPLTANWRRGAIVGIAIGLAAFFASGSGNSTAMNQSTANVKRIGPDEFEAEVVQSSSPVLVDFYATWCGPCKTLSPRVDKIAAEFSGKVKVVKVNVDESQAIAQRFGINAIPTLLVFENGKVVNTLVGLQSEADLRTHLQAAASQVSTGR